MAESTTATDFRHANWDVVQALLNSTVTQPPRPFRAPKFVTPTYEVSDYVEIGFLTAIAMVGCPLNLLALMRMLKSYSRQTMLRHFDLKTAYLLLKIHLSVANMLVLMTFCPGKIFWLVTYRWISGEVLCRVMHFLWLFAFNSSSNMIVCIAIDRLRTVCRLTALARGETGRHVLIAGSPALIRSTKIMVIIAYVAAIIFAVPQCLVWQVYEFAPNWHQCVTMWKAGRLNCLQSAANRGLVGHDCTEVVPLEQAYHIAHLVAIFFLPLLLVVLCYSFVLLRMSQFSFRPESMHIRRKSTPYHTQHSASDPDLELELDDFDPSSMPDHAPPSSVVPLPIRKQSYQTQQSFTGARRLSQALLSSQASTSSRASTKQPQRPARRSSISVGAVPNLQLHRKSRTFRSTALLITAFVVCWLPYNTAMLMHYLDMSSTVGDMGQVANDYANVLKGLILVNIVLNPFIFGFGDP